MMNDILSLHVVSSSTVLKLFSILKYNLHRRKYTMSDALYSKIEEVDKQVADDLRDGGLTDEDISNLCFEALKEIIPAPGLKGVVIRSRVWKIISEYNNEDSKSPQPPVVKKRTFNAVVIDDGEMPSNNQPSTSQDDQPSTSQDDQPSTSRGFFVKKTPVVSQAKSPQYTLYQDKDIDRAVKAGGVPVELRHRIIRGTVHNMISTAFNPPWNRMPTTNELLEMAKSLVVAYPLLSDPATKHGIVFKQLKKRLYNMKPVEKKRGPIKKKVKMEATKPQELSENGTLREVLDDSSSDIKRKPNSDNLEPKPIDDNEIMERHYGALAKEMGKSNPCPSTINIYLNKEFQARRDKITNMPAEIRHIKLFEEYPCFKNHVEIIEEARRILKRECKGPKEYKKECLEHLQNEMEYIIYFGVAKKTIVHPCKPTATAKLIHMMKNLSVIFNGVNGKSNKCLKKVVDLVYVLKEHEDPEVICSSKQCSKGPMLLVDSLSAYLICKGNILSTIEMEKFGEAVLALIGIFYLLDIDYPKSHELGLTVLQHLVFKDTSSPGDLLNIINATIAEFSRFKNSGV